MSKIRHNPCTDSGYHDWRSMLRSAKVQYGFGRKQHIADFTKCEKCGVIKIKRRKE